MAPLRLVILDCPYDTIHDLRTQDLLAKTVAVKILGYRASYPYGVLPVDSTDFVGTHALVCEETQEGHRVLSATKSVTLSRCREFNLPFPMQSLAKANTPEHAAYVEARIAEAAARGTGLLYQFSWTADPDIRSRDRELATTLKQIILAQLVFEALRSAPALVSLAGVPRVRTDRFFEDLGYHPAVLDGNRLPPFSVPSSHGEKAVFMDFREVTPQARSLMKRYQDLWDNRLVISERPAAAEAA